MTKNLFHSRNREELTADANMWFKARCDEHVTLDSRGEPVRLTTAILARPRLRVTRPPRSRMLHRLSAAAAGVRARSFSSSPM